MRFPFAFLLVAGAVALAGCGGGGKSVTKPLTGPQYVISIEIKGGKPARGIVHATVHKGQLVELVVNSDVADEVHLHGYDLHEDVKAGGTATIRFKANIAGVFEAELEHRKLQILELTVK